MECGKANRGGETRLDFACIAPDNILTIFSPLLQVMQYNKKIKYKAKIWAKYKLGSSDGLKIFLKRKKEKERERESYQAVTVIFCCDYVKLEELHSRDKMLFSPFTNT